MKNNPPRFSIITINLNNREGLRKTILSVLEQECRDFEYIVIDGASTDGSIDVIRKYKRSITSWISEKDSGIYNAMNKGLARAGGEYIYFLNSGDFFYSPHVLSEIHGMGTVFDILCGRVMTTDGSIQKPSPLWGNQESFYFIIKNFCHQAAFMRTQLCKKHPFDETYKICADRKMLLSLLFEEDATFRPINNLIAYFDLSGISTTSDKVILAEDARSLREALPTVILNDYRLLLCSPIGPYYMATLVHFQNPKKNLFYWCARIFRLAAKYLLIISAYCGSKAK